MIDENKLLELNDYKHSNIDYESNNYTIYNETIKGFYFYNNEIAILYCVSKSKKIYESIHFRIPINSINELNLEIISETNMSCYQKNKIYHRVRHKDVTILYDFYQEDFIAEYIVDSEKYNM